MSREMRALHARIDRLEPKLPPRRFPPGTDFNSFSDQEFLAIDVKGLSDDQLIEVRAQTRARCKARTGKELPETPIPQKRW